MHAPYERSHLVLVEVSNDVRFHPILLEDKMLTFPRAFSGVAVSVRGLLQDSFDFPMWKPRAQGFQYGLLQHRRSSYGTFVESILPYLVHRLSQIIHSEIARCRSGVQSSVVFCGCLLILTWALDMPLTCLELPGAAWRRENEGAMKRRSP